MARRAMTTPEHVAADQAALLKRPVRVLAFTSQCVLFRAIEREVVTAVVDASADDRDELRWCVYVGGECDSSVRFDLGVPGPERPALASSGSEREQELTNALREAKDALAVYAAETRPTSRPALARYALKRIAALAPAVEDGLVEVDVATESAVGPWPAPAVEEREPCGYCKQKGREWGPGCEENKHRAPAVEERSGHCVCGKERRNVGDRTYPVIADDCPVHAPAVEER